MKLSTSVDFANFMQKLELKNPGQPEYIQAVYEVLTDVIPWIQDNPEYARDSLLERICEPDRIIKFKVTWDDDHGNVHVNRGYRVQGKTAKSAEVVLDQAMKLQDAGCSFLLLEAMPTEPAGMIAEKLSIPVYGIGAGDRVDGQLVIFHDLVGLFWEFKSKFVKRYCEAGQLIQSALKEYRQEVKDGVFPAKDNFYEIKEEELEKLLGDSAWKYEKDRVENLAKPKHSVTPITTIKD